MGKFAPQRLAVLAIFLFAALLLPLTSVNAQESNGSFSIQVTPSPLVFSAKPGVATTVDLKIRNAGPVTEELKIEPRAFEMNQLNGEIKLLDTTPPQAADWLSFSDPVFTVKPGEWFTQKVTFNPPDSVGFSYSFALQISRTQEPDVDAGERALKGSVAVFTLINIDRPDATSKLEIATFSTAKNVYEYLPATFSVTLRNSGNTILQPYGNIFIQRSGDDSEPITSLPFNEQRGYILPGVTRTIETIWDEGFPVYKTTTENGKTSTNLVWDWTNVSDLRVGKYTAKLVAVYNDGTRDVPLEATVQFWVLPWKFILAGIVIFLVFAFGLWSMIGRAVSGVRKKSDKNHDKKARKAAKKSEEAPIAEESED